MPEYGKKKRNSVHEITVFAMLGTIMYLSKILMEWAPNVHFLSALTVLYTLVYRKKALIPIYIYVFLNGLFSGFAAWWIPYLYIWTVLWGLAMLLPRKLPAAVCALLCSALCFLHGISFGTLYAPAQALLYGFDFKTTLAWIAAGFPWDVIHALGNLASSVVILPLAALLCRLEHKELPFKRQNIKKREQL